MSKDWHAKGEKDQHNRRNNDTMSIITSGGQGTWKPPSGKDDRNAYKAGWENAKKQK
jgi:hypothetical protein